MTAPTTTAVDVTAGYYGGAGLALRLFRLALGASQRVWPGLAVRAAGRLFRTPLPLKWLQRRGGMGAGWRTESWPFEDASITVYQPAAAPQAPLALLVHGWGGQARQMLPLAGALAARGLRPVLLEMPAHGRSAGTASNLPQFARAIDYAVARLQHEGHTVQLLGAHSLGANAAAYAAARALREPSVRERLAGQGLFPSGSLPDEFGAQIRKEIDKMQRISRFAKISLD